MGGARTVNESQVTIEPVGRLGKKAVFESDTGTPKIVVARHWTAYRDCGSGPWWCAKGDVLRSVVVAMRQMAAAASADPNRAGGVEYWFGDAKQIKTVESRLRTYNEFLRKLSLLLFECATKGEYADSYAAVAQDKFDAGSTELRVLLGDCYKDSKHSLGVIVNSLLHELSHVCLRTDDVPKNEKNSKKKFYGAKKARQLAVNDPSLAITNAENWGYYLCGFYQQVTNYGAIDWKKSYERI